MRIVLAASASRPQTIGGQIVREVHDTKDSRSKPAEIGKISPTYINRYDREIATNDLPGMSTPAARVPFNSLSITDGVNGQIDQSPFSRPQANGGDRPFPHIKDIIAAAQPKFDPTRTCQEYLKQAETSTSAVRWAIGNGKLDKAFLEYLSAWEIALNSIPRHKDYGFLEYNDKKFYKNLTELTRQLSSMETQMKGVRRMIEDNNTRYNTQQQSTTSGQNVISNPSTTTATAAASSDSRSALVSPDISGLPEQLQVKKARPQSVAKPDHLRVGAASTSTDLSSRLAALRTNGIVQTQRVEMPDSQNYQSPVTVNGSNGLYKPAGPRAMPNSFPTVPAKLPLLPAAMPQPPAPTLSSNAARVSQDFHRPPTERKQTYYGKPISSVPARAQQESAPYRPRTPNGVNLAIISKSNSADIPYSHTITAETLVEYSRKYNVLVVDIRERQQFDEGHISASSILCIEPLALKEGTSADVLEERLIVSPENEQVLFSKRNEFDLIVYYDLGTDNVNYLQGGPSGSRTPHLRAFYDTLVEFNESKPLRDGRPPALLEGGINAWVDLMGSNSLATSKTAAMLGTSRQRLAVNGTPSRPVQRLASANSRFEIRDRRLRNQKFLNEQEQSAWREQAQQEHVPTTQAAISEGDYFAEEPDELAQPASPFVSDYESFFRRYPSVDQQSMTVAQSRPIPPPKRYASPPPPIPRLPSQPPPPVPQLPAIPTRPPPAIPRPSYSGQVDLAHAPQSQRLSSGARQPLYSNHSISRPRPLPRTGLTNFGVTCYMNATLQCLSATLPLATFFTSPDRPYQANIQKNWKGSNGIMPEIFANVIRSLWHGDVNIIKPSTFRGFCGRMNKEWGIDRQQDAKEFFDFLIDCLHEDLNLAWQRTPLKPLTPEEELVRERYPISDAAPIEWNRFTHRDRSFISSLFAGQHASRLRCLECNGTSTTYEAFYSISIEIPRQGSGDIYSCLRSYCQEERLTEEERWKCPYCRKETDATKQILLTRLPKFLVVHFKRFEIWGTGRARKVHTPIEFPLVGLSMDKFVVPPSEEQMKLLANGHTSTHVNGGLASGNTDTGSGKEPPALESTPPFNYDCYGVLRHLGNSGDGGHYIALVKDSGRGCWRRFDDEKSVDFDPERLNGAQRLQNGEAYILFFQRK